MAQTPSSLYTQRFVFSSLCTQDRILSQKVLCVCREKVGRAPTRRRSVWWRHRWNFDCTVLTVIYIHFWRCIAHICFSIMQFGLQRKASLSHYGLLHMDGCPHEGILHDDDTDDNFDCIDCNNGAWDFSFISHSRRSPVCDCVALKTNWAREGALSLWHLTLKRFVSQWSQW